MHIPLLSSFRRPGVLRTHAALLLLLAPTAGAQTPVTRLQRGTIEYAGANYDIQSAVLSANGKYVALEATATNITSEDTNDKRDVFLVEVDTNYVHLVSHVPGSTGPQGVKPLPGNGDSMHPAVSADGRWVAFASDADDLLGPGLDTNNVRDVFLFDREDAQGAALIRISAPQQGGQADGASDHPSVDDSGNQIVFESVAQNLIPNQPPLFAPQVFYVGRSTPWSVVRVSNSTTGGLPNGQSTRPVISGNGDYIAYESQAWDLALNDGNGNVQDVFIVQRATGTTVIASRDPLGQPHLARTSGHPSISYLGDLVAFESTAENLAGAAELNIDWDIFVSEWDGSTPMGVQILTRVSQAVGGTEADGDSRNPFISRDQVLALDGQFVVFESTANNLDSAPGLNTEVEVFGVDRLTQEATLLSAASVGVASWDCTRPSIAANLNEVSFISVDDNIALPIENPTGDPNVPPDPDVFLRRIPDGSPEVYCTGSTSVLGCTSDMTFSGTPSESSSNPFSIIVTGLRAWVPGQFFYSVEGPNNAAIGGMINNGYLCVVQPFQRLQPTFSTGGTIGVCNGATSIDMNAYIQDPSYLDLDAGTRVWMQAWARDGSTGSHNDVVLTKAISFVIQP